MGEVTVELTSPEGETIIVYDGNHHGQENFNGNIGWDNELAEEHIYFFYGENPTGTWSLKISDGLGEADGGTGVDGILESWTLRLNEEWNGDIFVGNKVTAQNSMVVRGEARVEYGGDLVFTDTNGTETIRIDGETGSIDGIEKPEFRWRKWCTYNETWAMNNNADMFGGIAPSDWSNGYYAHQMSSDKGILSTFYTNRGYVPSSGNINLVSDAYTTYDTKCFLSCICNL